MQYHCMNGETQYNVSKNGPILFFLNNYVKNNQF